MSKPTKVQRAKLLSPEFVAELNAMPDDQILAVHDLTHSIMEERHRKPQPKLIPWSGGSIPENGNSQIHPVYRGPAAARAVRITCGPADKLAWSHNGSDDDIVGYYLLYDANERRP